MVVQHLVGPTGFADPSAFSVLTYNVLLPNSVDGWWNIKMYHPATPWESEGPEISSWAYRQSLLRQRIETVNADVVCLQEVSPLSFDEDFAFMNELGYTGKEMFKKGRFRPATFWKGHLSLAASPIHKDRTLLTAFESEKDSPNWYVLNCHLQAGKEGRRRVRQIDDGVKAVRQLARKLREKEPEQVPLIVCGDFNGGPECGAVRYLEDGKVDETNIEDGEPVTSKPKFLPLQAPLTDVASVPVRPPPPTLVVPELISLMVQDAEMAFEKPVLSKDMITRLRNIYDGLASHETESGKKVMNVENVKTWLTTINGQVGRGSEFREAAKQMGWEKPEDPDEDARIALPEDGVLDFDGFVHVYQKELNGGKFWGIAYDMSVLGSPLPVADVFTSRFDRMYCSAVVETAAVMDFVSNDACPNDREPSDHLPVAASFRLRTAEA